MVGAAVSVWDDEAGFVGEHHELGSVAGVVFGEDAGEGRGRDWTIVILTECATTARRSRPPRARFQNSPSWAPSGPRARARPCAGGQLGAAADVSVRRPPSCELTPVAGCIRGMPDESHRVTDARARTGGALPWDAAVRYAGRAGPSVRWSASVADGARLLWVPELPSGAVTFCFTDVEGSSALSARLGEALFGTMIERHREILRDAWRPWGGVEVNTEGDGCFVVFADVDAALAACVRAQQRLAVEGWPADAAFASAWACTPVTRCRLSPATTSRWR